MSATFSPIIDNWSVSLPYAMRDTGARDDAMTSEPISLIWKRRIPGIVAIASFCTPSITCQMSRFPVRSLFLVILSQSVGFRSSLSERVIMKVAALTDGMA